jgi:hypothetical protein
MNLRSQHTPSKFLAALATLMLVASLASDADAAAPRKLSGSMIPDGELSNTYAITTPANPANARVVFRAARVTAGVNELWSTPISGGDPINLSGPMVSGGDVRSFKLSKDGTRAVFLADKDTDETVELYSVPVDGSALPTKRSGTLVTGGNVETFAISDDSQRIVYRADKDVEDRIELYSVPITSGSGMKLVNITTATRDVDSFLISPDSTRVVFLADLDTSNIRELYSVGITSTSVTKVSKPLVTGGSISLMGGYAISPNSTRVAYRADADTLDRRELYSVSILGGSSLTHSGSFVAGGNVSIFSFTPNSSHLVFLANKETDTVSELYSVPITSQSPLKISAPVAQYGEPEEFKISDDSSRVVYKSSESATNSQRLYSVPVTNTQVVPLCALSLPGDSVFSDEFFISADSTRVAFVADVAATSRAELFSASIAGGNCINLSVPTQANGRVLGDEVKITPDSKRVLFVADKDTNGVLELYSVPLAGGTATKLSGDLTADGDISEFAVSADSKWVAFSGDKDTNNLRELYSVSVDGGGALLDIDGDGKVLATTDMLLILRYQLGIRGGELITNALGIGATRNTSFPVEQYLRRVLESPSLE